MISKPIISLGAFALASIAAAKPIPAFRDIIAKRGNSHSFNGYKGYGSMSHFDDFYGSEDFSGVSQTLVQDKEVVCHSVEVEVVQQHLAVIREWYKKIITEQVCEVEVQTIVHHQFISGCESFCGDIRRTSNRHVSYDHEIASKIVHIHDSSSECVTDNLGFSGHDIGSHAISYSGDNWNSHYSPHIVSTAWNYAQQSHGYSSPAYASSWSSSYVPPSYTYVSSNTYAAPSYNHGYTYAAPPPTYTGISSYGYGSSYSPPSDCGSSGCAPPPPPSDCGSSDCSPPPPSSDCGSSDCSPPPPPSDCGSSDCAPPPPPSDCSSPSGCPPPPPPPSDCSSPSGCPSNGTDVSSNSTSVASTPSGNSSVPIPTDSASAAAATTSSAVATEDPGVPASAPAPSPTA